MKKQGLTWLNKAAALLPFGEDHLEDRASAYSSLAAAYGFAGNNELMVKAEEIVKKDTYEPGAYVGYSPTACAWRAVKKNLKRLSNS